MNEHADLRTRLRAVAGLFAVGFSATLITVCNDADGWIIGMVTLLGAAMLAVLLPHGRVGRIVGIAATVVAVPLLWLISTDELGLLLNLASVLGTYHVVRWHRETPRAAKGSDAVPAKTRQQTASPAEARLPAGVADERLLDRLAVHEMTRARRYEHPLTLLLVDIDGWPGLLADRGARGAYDQLSLLAVRIRRLLRDVDAIGLHGEHQLAILLPETPLDGALVVANRIEEAAREDVGLSVRVGAAVFPDDAVTVEGLLHEADAALDLARLEGLAVAQRIVLR